MTTAAEEPQAPDVAEAAPRSGRALIATITTAHFSHHVTNSLLTPLLPFIRDTFGMSYAESGFAVSAYNISLGLSNAPWGVLADRIGSRTVMAVGLVLMAALSAILASVSSYVQLVVLLVGLGAVSGSYHAPAAAVIARAFRPGVRGAVMGLHITGGHLSFFAAPVVASFLVTQTGTWRTPYLWFAAAPLVLGGLLWLVAPRAHERAAATDRLAAFREIGHVFRDVGPLISLALVFQFGIAALIAFLALYLVDARGVPPAAAAFLFALVQLAGVVGAPLGGWLSDRIGRSAVILGSLALMGPAAYAVTIAPLDLMALVLVVFGLLWAMRSTVTETFVMDTAPPLRRGTVLGAYYLANAHVGGLGAPIFGVLAQAVGIGIAMSWAGIAFVALSLFTVVFARRLA